MDKDTIRPKNSDLFHIVTYYIKWGTTSWTYSRLEGFALVELPSIL